MKKFKILLLVRRLLEQLRMEKAVTEREMQLVILLTLEWILIQKEE